MEGAATQTGTASTSSSCSENFSTSTLAYDREFIRTAPGILVVAEIVFGLIVWTLIAGTEYFRVPAFGWVIFVAILYWVLTVIFFIIYLTMVKRIPQVSWKTVGLCFNGSAAVMYAVATGVDAASISKDARGRYNYNCWTASTCFALLVTLCYAGSTYFSFKSWRLREEEQ
ncbi:CKLF-like MARVEL transmembrane domain-containing protein 8b [Esox lucius]|uniref:MARVEL domain-containing protein n=1 Tax=Esox lucius TaxID=8010 RepID=A0A3P8XG68_ESOLU|nr:CKLF-like MARVEL transmembrane domain-containing protein 8b [Esox lucius]